MESQSTVNKLETGSFSGIPTPSRNVSCLGSLHQLTVTHRSDRAACRDQPSATKLDQTAGENAGAAVLMQQGLERCPWLPASSYSQ